jgi:hypothetical protein
MPTEPRTVWVVCPNACDGQRDERDLPCTECDGSGGYDAIALPLASGKQVVVTKEALERGAEAVCKAARQENNMLYPWAEVNGQGRAQYGEDFLSILTAAFPAGIVVADDVRVVFDGPPGSTCGRFIECETPDGASVSIGDWHEREDGLWELRISALLKEKP